MTKDFKDILDAIDTKELHQWLIKHRTRQENRKSILIEQLKRFHSKFNV